MLYVNCFGRTMLYMCIEYHIQVHMYHVSAQGVDERMINVHYYYYYYFNSAIKSQTKLVSLVSCTLQPVELSPITDYRETSSTIARLLGIHGHGRRHTPSIAFRHLPPNSARFSYATEGALFISAQLSSDAVSALRKVRVLIRLWTQPSAQVRT